ncbi:MAG: hypothetical protein C0394_01155 [Syntrophus sp. (in: bacteria)]|nr:hypothetical protein [Syntrophus sp. (in: bacteria)]
MTQAEIPLQTGFNQSGHLRDSLCRSFLNICIKTVAISILIQMSATDACSEWKIMTWQPFQVRTELMPQAGKGKAVRRGKTAPSKSLKIQGSYDIDIGTENLQRSLQAWPDAQSRYISELPARVWRGYLWNPRPDRTLPQTGLPGETLFSSEIFRNVPGRDNLLNLFPDNEPSAVKENGSARPFRLSFFSRDMQYLNRDVAGRDASRYSSWEMILLQPTGMRNQPAMETIGRIFEPRVDLKIEF